MTRLVTAAKDAILLQDACNLSGIVHTWHKHMEALWAEARDNGHGTEWVNTHPICQLFSDKVAQLTQGTSSGYSQAYEVCERLSRGESSDRLADVRQI